ncbi:MAG: polysaccharide deacetylase [Actinomycetia bacterium]|nr:polysaccharide deacetylase [Actinomycetes bacterium]
MYKRDEYPQIEYRVREKPPHPQTAPFYQGLLDSIPRGSWLRAHRKLIVVASVSALTLTVVLFALLSTSEVEDANFSRLVKRDIFYNSAAEVEVNKVKKRDTFIEEADIMAARYDYEGAIAHIASWQDYENDDEMLAKIDGYRATMATLVPVDIYEVTHIFYHSLIVDPERAFAEHDYDAQSRGLNQWMTTMAEFNMITQEMYERGFVLVSIHDLVHETTDENGRAIFEPGTIMLPPDKKAFVLSIDDVSYYHTNDGYGMANKLVINDAGDVVSEYLAEDGSVRYGAYDIVPLLDQFIDMHPDASYKGAKGIIALTGYNGVLGYRTDETYDINHSQIDGQQRAFLQHNPSFSLESERSIAKEVADAMKADGWEFASHTWGHLKAGDDPLGYLVDDTERWMRNVEPIVGATDVMIWAFGQDVQFWGEYNLGEAKLAHFMANGFRIFCGVSSEPYNVILTPDYLRMRRRNIDGYRIYFNSIGVADDLWDLFDPMEVLDPLRPPVSEISSPKTDDAAANEPPLDEPE